MYAVIVGGGKVGRNLARELVEDGVTVAIVEKDSGKCEHIASKINALIINGDGADYSALESAGSKDANYLIAVTGSDEVNFVVCLLAKISFNVKMTLARVNDLRNEGIFRKSGVDFIFTTPDLISRMMHEVIKCKDCGFPFVIPTFLDRRSKFGMVRFVIENNSPSVGKMLKELKLPKGALVISIIKDDEITIPYGSSVIEEGDTLYVISRKDIVGEVRTLLSGEE